MLAIKPLLMYSAGIFCILTFFRKMLVKKEEEFIEKPNIDLNNADLVVLGPHPYQTVPPLFDSDVTYFNPDDTTLIREAHGKYK